jgi:hypothetical protein
MTDAERAAHWKDKADAAVKERDQEIATRRRAQQDRDTAYRLVVEAEAREAKLRAALKDAVHDLNRDPNWRRFQTASDLLAHHCIDPETLSDRKCRCSEKPHAEGAPECSFGRWFEDEEKK